MFIRVEWFKATNECGLEILAWWLNDSEKIVMSWFLRLFAAVLGRIRKRAIIFSIGKEKKTWLIFLMSKKQQFVIN